MENGYIIYRGKSNLNGKPIVVVALMKGNNKTGNMIQLYILVDGIDPREANKIGCDDTICGNCKHKGDVSINPLRKIAENRSCYVQLGQGVLVVYNQMLKGAYPDISCSPDKIADLAIDRSVRVGAYGDGHAVPDYVIDCILSKSDGHTGYTHQADHPMVKLRHDIYMLSVESLQGAIRFWNKGYRTFRVLAEGDTLTSNEILCPASKEAGFKVTCNDCLLCGGTSVNAKSIAIYAHGAGKGNL
jgi:hypothetical protein